MGDTDEITLFYYPFSSPSRKILTALYEKKVNFIPRQIRLLEREQHEKWYLELNPRGEVPVLKHGDKVIVDSPKIMDYIDQTFGMPNQLFPQHPMVKDKVAEMLKKIDPIPMFPLSYGAVVFHREEVTDKLRWPYDDPEMVKKYKLLILSAQQHLRKRAIECSEMEAGKVLAEKAEAFDKIWPIFQDKDMYLALLSQVEALLDDVEKELSSPAHLGPWLCGPSYTAADIGFSCLLVRLHQMGMDDKLWKGGVRPAIAVYAELAFARESLEKATEVNKHKNKIYYLAPKGQRSEMNAAYIGLGAAVALGAVYAYKKLKR